MTYIKQTLKRIFKLKSLRAKPHFLGIGTQKGGTTTLYRLLKKHPDIFLPENKEIHYFTKNYYLGDEWYINHFQEASPGQIRGEITPYYLFHAAVPGRIKSFKNNMKFIILLRDPVERTLSQYFHSVRLGLEDLSLEDALNAEEDRLENSASIISKPNGKHLSHQEHSYLSRSRYDIQIKRYSKYFKKKNMLIISSEKFFKDDGSCMNSISNFLQVKNFSEGIKITKENQGKGESYNVSDFIKRKIRQRLYKTYEWIENEIGISWE